MNIFDSGSKESPEQKREHKKFYLKHHLPKVHLFYGVQTFSINEIVNQFWDKFEIIDFRSGKKRSNEIKKIRSVCSLLVNDKVIFVVKGDILIFSEVTQAQQGLTFDEEKTISSLIKRLKPYQHFGDAFYSNLDSIKGSLNIKLQTRDSNAEWISISRKDFEDAIDVINKAQFLENAYDKKSDDYHDLVLRIQQSKEGNVYDKLRNFILINDDNQKFDLKTFNQQVIADAIQCDRTAVNKEFKALKKLEGIEQLGIQLGGKKLRYKYLPDISATIPAYKRLKFFIEQRSVPVSSHEKKQLMLPENTLGLMKMSFSAQVKKDMIKSIGLTKFELNALLSKLQQWDEKLTLINSGQAQSILIYADLPKKI